MAVADGGDFYQFQHRRTQTLMRLSVRHSPAGCASVETCSLSKSDRRSILAYNVWLMLHARAPRWEFRGILLRGQVSRPQFEPLDRD